MHLVSFSFQKWQTIKDGMTSSICFICDVSFPLGELNMFSLPSLLWISLMMCLVYAAFFPFSVRHRLYQGLCFQYWVITLHFLVIVVNFLFSFYSVHRVSLFCLFKLPFTGYCTSWSDALIFMYFYFFSHGLFPGRFSQS